MLIADWITLSPEVARALWTTYILIQAFWPLTVVLAIALFVWWRQRSSIAARVFAIIALVLWTPSAYTYVRFVGGEALNQAQIRARQETLATPTTIAGITLPAGTQVMYPSAQARDQIESLQLQKAADVYGIPLTGPVNFTNGRPDGSVTLARDAVINGIPCSAKASVRLDSGRLDTCTLSRPTRIQGIPCQGEVSFGTTLGCTLASTYARFGVTWRAGTEVGIAGDSATFDIKAGAPNLNVLGMSLPHRAIVTYENGRLHDINFSTEGPWHYRNCAVMFVTVNYAAQSHLTTDSCGLPRDKNDVVFLPTTAFTIR